MSHSTEDRPARQGNRRSGNRPRNNNNNSNRGRQSQDGRQSGRSSEGGRTRQPVPRAEPPQLTLWQKILKAVGLYKEPEPPKARRPQKQFDEPRQPRKSNTRGATPRPPREAPDPDKVSGTRLYLGNLSFDATESDLEELFKGVGPVRNIDIVYNRSTHRSKGYGFIEMGRVDDAKRAVEVLHDQPFMGRQLIVNEAKSKGPADASLDSGDDSGDE